MLKLAGFFLAARWCVRMTKYCKQPLSFHAQLEQLQSRGLGIADPAHADHFLQRVGYYRLMGYLYPQRLVGSDHFRSDATFEEAVDLYEFDRVLRDLVMEAVGHIEVATRTLLTYHFSHAHGAFGHLDQDNFSFSAQQHREWLEGVCKEVERSKETFIRHYKDKYTQPQFPNVPIWMATEVMSLGSLSRFYKALRGAEQKSISRAIELAPPVFENWLHVTSVARNVVAHHGRLWNKELGVSAVRPRSAGWSEREATFPTGRCFFLLLLLRRLLVLTTADHVVWRDRVETHLSTGLISSARISSLGASEGWDSHRLWRG
jgi:abortive infection bacteriophage resistance protein